MSRASFLIVAFQGPRKSEGHKCQQTRALREWTARVDSCTATMLAAKTRAIGTLCEVEKCRCGGVQGVSAKRMGEGCLRLVTLKTVKSSEMIVRIEAVQLAPLWL